jgi:hypothetical protein
MLVLLIRRRVTSKFLLNFFPSLSYLTVICKNFTRNETDNTSRFYYADERKPDGGAVYNAIDGDAHAKHYLELAEGKIQGPWQQTFVKGIGYKSFLE